MTNTWSPQRAYTPLVGENWGRVIFEGQMNSMGCAGGHNDRYFVIEGLAAVKLTWGDFRYENIHYPVLIDPRPFAKETKIIEVFEPVYILSENFSDYSECKKHEVKNFDWKQFSKKYTYDFDPEEFGFRFEAYDAEFIREKSWGKIENGVLLEQDRSNKSKLF